MDTENINLGACCVCEKMENVWNIIMLNVKGEIAGHGWGCFQCGLPNDGAVAVICDDCLEANAEIKFACSGYPATGGRIEIEKLTEVFEHDMSKHREAFSTGGERICVVCGCTDSVGCEPDGCYWVSDRLCSECYFDETDDF